MTERRARVKVSGDIVTASVGRPARLSAQPADLRRQNFSAILRTLLCAGPMARAELAHTVGLASGTVTKLTAELLAAGLLTELPATPARRAAGRPRIPVDIDTNRFRVAGAHIGLLRTVIGLVDLKGGVVAERELVHPSRDPGAIIGQLIDGLRALMAGHVVAGIGVSLSGRIDPDSDVVREHGPLDWHNVPLGAPLAAAFGLPIVIDSTVRALVHAESTFGQAQATTSFLQVFIGNIVSGTFVLGGRPHVGPDGADGDLTHLSTGAESAHVCSCGRTDCLQAAASDEAVVAEAKELGLIGPAARYGEVVRAARAGNGQVLELLRVRDGRVGAALAHLIEVLDPHLVILAGGIIEDPHMLANVRAAVERCVRRPLAIPPAELIVTTSFGSDAPMFASAALVLEAFYRRPTDLPPLARGSAEQVPR